MVLCRKFRPEKLKFYHSCPNAPAAVTCAQEALMAESNTQLNHQRQSIVSGGFTNFAAAYPQYCESKCPAAAVDSVDGCCQHGARFMVEPSYANQGPTQLLSFVYVGSQTDACDADVMRRHGITHVLNVSANCVQSQHVPEANFMRVPVNDGYSDKLLPHFKRAFQFLENVRRSNGRCLVHCLAGISRSPTVAIAYIMQHLRLSQDDAYRYVKTRRPSISPNFNFLGQLMEFERQLQQQQQQSASSLEAEKETAASSSDSDEAESACSEAKRQRRFCLSLPASTTSSAVPANGPSPTPTGALSRLSFAAAQQQQAQFQKQTASATTTSTAPAILLSTTNGERRQLIKRRQRPNSEVLLDQSASQLVSSSVAKSADAEDAAPSSRTGTGSQELITCS